MPELKNASLGQIAYAVAQPDGDYAALRPHEKRRWETMATRVIEMWHKQLVQPSHTDQDIGLYLYANGYSVYNEGVKWWWKEHGIIKARFRMAARHVIGAVARRIIKEQEDRICGDGRIQSLYTAQIP